MSKKYAIQSIQNVNGQDIKLIVNSNDKKRAFVEYIVEDGDQRKVRKKSIIVLILSLINIATLYLDVLPQTIILVNFIIISFIVVQLLTKVKRERLLIIKSLGLQYSIIYHLGSKRTQFVPWDVIQKVLINEVITMQRVLYFLTIIVQNDQESIILMPLFQHLRPRLQHLELIYSQINDILN